MSRLTYEEALRYNINDLRIIDDEPYRLVSIKTDILARRKQIELVWRHVIDIFLNVTLVEFPGSMSYQKLKDLLEKDQIDFEDIIEEIGEEGW